MKDIEEKEEIRLEESENKESKHEEAKNEEVRNENVVPVSIFCENATLINYNNGKRGEGGYKIETNQRNVNFSKINEKNLKENKSKTKF